jgi:tripartite-type tricarboxylate transporter receptor subunit TctC
MKKINMLLLVVSLVIIMNGFVITGKALSSEANAYPQRDITFVVPTQPGAVFDIVARATAPYFSKYLPRKVNILVQNITGAGGRAGIFQMYDSKPDGYTIGLLNVTVLVVPELLGQTTRTVDRLNWLGRATMQPMVLGISPKGPIRTIEDLIKAKKVTVAVNQTSIAGQIAFFQEIGVELKPIIYGGGTECALAVMRGEVDVTPLLSGTMFQQVESSGGKIIPLGVFSEKRISEFPNVRTFKEAGINMSKSLLQLLDYDTAFAVPYGVPADVLKILTEALAKTIADPEYIALMEKVKYPVNAMSAAEMKIRATEIKNAFPNYIEKIRKLTSK